jgi:hypothetical protein
MLELRLPRFNRWLRERGLGDGFAMGIGLNSGHFMSGNVGSAQRLEYTVHGDTVNTAARLEEMTKSARQPILIAESTRRALLSPPDISRTRASSTCAGASRLSGSGRSPRPGPRLRRPGRRRARTSGWEFVRGSTQPGGANRGRRTRLFKQDTKVEALKSTPLFQDLSRTQLVQLARVSENLEVPPGKVLCKEGENRARVLRGR